MPVLNAGEESALIRLVGLLNPKYKQKKKETINIMDTYEDSINGIDVTEILNDENLDDQHSDGEECDNISTKGIHIDGFDSFNMDYQGYLKYCGCKHVDKTIELPFYRPYTVTSTTRIINQICDYPLVPDPLTQAEVFAIDKNITKHLCKKKHVQEFPQYLKMFFNCLNSYVDVLQINNRISDFRLIRYLYSLHTMNHIVKSRRIFSDTEMEGNDEIKCEGFTRPRVLILCGLRCIAKEVIEHMAEIISLSKKADKMERFEAEFNLEPEQLQHQMSSFQKTYKTQDYIETFTGNQDDAFKIGLRYQSGLLHLFTPFYNSDIIIASPLGLKVVIGSNGDKERDYDFLSSVEVVICDRADIIKYQNWRFFTDVWESINKPLVKWRDANINRIRTSVIDGQLADYRQNIFISCFRHPIFNAFIRRFMNKRGLIKLIRPCDRDYLILGTKLRIQQLFIKVATSDIKNAQEDIMNYFLKTMLNNLSGIHGILLVVSDQTQYLRMYKQLEESFVEYLPCHEAVTNKKMLYARQQFQAGKIPMLVTSFRLLFFKRYLFKGVTRAFLLEPPEYGPLYKDILRMLDVTKSNNTIICYYTKYHASHLEPIVGSLGLRRLMKATDYKVTLFH